MSILFLVFTSCSTPPAAPTVEKFKEGAVAPGDPVPALAGTATTRVRLGGVVRNAAELKPGQPLSLKLSGRVRLAVGASPAGPETVTFTISGGNKSEKMPVAPDQGWVELDLTFPAGVEAISVSADAPSGAYLANPRAVTPGPFRLAGLLVIDALRADALGIYGAKDNPSPNIDAFAKQSAVFTRAHTASSFTLTSVASILTGLWPWQHAVIFEPESGLMLSPQVPSLVENFRAAGWHTAAFSGTYFSFADNGFARGFDLMDESCADKFFEGSADCLAGRVKTFLEEHADEPVFVYVHFVDTHAPYWPPEPFRSRFTRGLQKSKDLDTARGETNQFEESRGFFQFLRSPSSFDRSWLRGLYQGEVAYVDDRLGPVLALISARCNASGQAAACAVALSSDHGEAFDEHGAMGHIADLFEPVMRVPLFFFGQGAAPAITADARSIDLLPSLLDASGIALPSIPGRSLLSDLHGAVRQKPAAALHFVKGKKEYVLVSWPWKIFYRPDKNKTRLYNLEADPNESTDLAGRQPETVKELMAELTRQLSLPAPGKAGGPTDNDTLKRLHDLGYINK